MSDGYKKDNISYNETLKRTRYNLHSLKKTINKEKKLHNYATSYYRHKNFALVLPSIIITGLCSVGSFMASSDIVLDDMKNTFTISVGVLTIIATTLQSLSNSLGYGIRSEMFRKSADLYDKILTTVEFEINKPNEEDFLNKIEEKILSIKDECKYLPPQWMEKKIIEDIRKEDMRTNIRSNNLSIV